MTQDTWQYQGRQQHGQWGHGTAPHADKQPDLRPLTRGPGRENPPAPAGIAERAAYAAYGVAVHLPLSKMDVYEARLRGGMLEDFQKAMTAFPDTAHLGDEAYRDRVLDSMLTLTETHQLRVAGLVIHTARTLDDLAPAITALANVVKSAGLSFTGKALDAAAKSALNTRRSFRYASVDAGDFTPSGRHAQLAQEFLPFGDDLAIGRIPEWIRKLPQAIRDRPMERVPNQSGKEGSKGIPEWAKGRPRRIGETSDDFAEKLMDGKYGRGNWKKTSKEYSEIKKFGQRAFRYPKDVLRRRSMTDDDVT